MKYIRLLLCCSLFLFNLNVFTLNIDEGKDLFKTRCVSCHAIDKILVGPALKNVHEKYDIDWFVKFVTSSSTMIAAKDPKALKIFNQFNKIPMLDHKDLSENQIKNIYEYIKSQSTVLASQPVINPIPRLENKKSNLQPIQGSDTWIIWIWVGITFIIILGLLIAVTMNDLKDVLQKK